MYYWEQNKQPSLLDKKMNQGQVRVRVKQCIRSPFLRTPFPLNFRLRVTSRRGGFGTLAERYGERIRCFTPPRQVLINGKWC